MMSITCTSENATNDKVKVRIFNSNRMKRYCFSLKIEDKRDFTKKLYNFAAYIVTDITKKDEIRISIDIENETQSEDNQNIFSEMGYNDCKQMSEELIESISNYLKNNNTYVDDYLIRKCVYSPGSENYIDKKNKIFKFFAFDDYNLLVPDVYKFKFLDYVRNLVKCKKPVFTSEEDYLIWEKALTDKSFNPEVRNRIISDLIEYIFYSSESKETDERLIDWQIDAKNIEKYRIRSKDDYKKYLEKELLK